MDSLKSLMDRKDYDLVLSLTRDSSDADALFFRASAFLAKNESNEALRIMVSHRSDLYRANPMLTIKATFEIRFIRKEFDEAYKDLDEFLQKPYVSQVVEEYLKALPKIIRTNERSSSLAQTYTDADIERILKTSDDDYEVLALLNYLQHVSLSQYISYIQEVLVSSRHPHVKTYALLLLVASQYGQEVTFNKNGRVYHLIPKDLVPPYQGSTYDDFVHSVAELSRDPSVSSIALSLLNDYIMDCYPDRVIVDADDKLLAVALIKLAREYLHSSIGVDGYLDKYALVASSVEEKATLIKATLEKTPALKI
jgi:hypothetical protein